MARPRKSKSEGLKESDQGKVPRIISGKPPKGSKRKKRKK